MKPITGPAQAVRPLPDDQTESQTPDPRQGLLPGLLVALCGYQRTPPERAMYRELLMAAVGRTSESHTVGGLTISAATIKLVAWTLFGRMNAAGVIIDETGHPFRRQTLADDASITLRVVHAALIYLQRVRLIAIDPARGRQRAIIRVNLGGLDWSAVLRRVKLHIAANTTTKLPRADHERPLPLPLCGEAPSPQEVRSGEAPSPLEGVRTEGKISGPAAAGSTPRASSANRRQHEQQQQRDQARLEGLLGAVASRARQLGHDFDEADERRRFAKGEIDVAALQALADDLEAELADRGDVRRHRITPGLDGGGRCAVCGRRPSSETELCPGRPRRSRIQALAEDCAGAATATRAG